VLLDLAMCNTGNIVSLERLVLAFLLFVVLAHGHETTFEAA
jgi:hypothetical protein